MGMQTSISNRLLNRSRDRNCLIPLPQSEACFYCYLHNLAMPISCYIA